LNTLKQQNIDIMYDLFKKILHILMTDNVLL